MKPPYNDPTYNRIEIENNKVWAIAFILSECYNNNAPLGWSNYIWVAKLIVESLDKNKTPNE